MPNPFDKFDAPATGNPFDRFDTPAPLDSGGEWTAEKLRSTMQVMRAAGYPETDIWKFVEMVGGKAALGVKPLPPEKLWTDEDMRGAIERAPNTSEAEKRAKLRALEHGRSYVPVGEAAESMGAGIVDSTLKGATSAFWDEAGGAITSRMRDPKYGTVSPEAATDVMRNQMDEYAHNHPARDIAGQMAGNIASLYTGGKALKAVSPGSAKNMGRLLLSGRLPKRSAAGAGLGFLDAAAYGFGEGEGGWENRFESAKNAGYYGAAGGAAAPIAGKVLGKYLGKPLARAIAARKDGKHVSSGAAKTLARLLSREDMHEIRSMSPTVPALAKVDAAMYGARAMHGAAPDASRIITKAAKGYREDAGERAMSGIAAAIGRGKSIRKALGEFATARKAKAGPLYEAAREAARPVNINKAIDLIDSHLSPGVRKVFGSEAGPPLTKLEGSLRWIKSRLHNERGAQIIDYDDIKKLTEEMYDQFLTRGSKPNERRVITPIRRALVEALDTATTGVDGVSLHKRARTAFSSEMEVKEAYELGTKLMKGGQSGVDIEDLIEDVGRMSVSEKDALAMGMSTAVRLRAEDATPGALLKMFNRADSGLSKKLRTVFGDAKGEKLRKALAFEEDTYHRAGRAIYGSDTAQTQAARGALDIKAPKASGVTSGELATGATALTGDLTYAGGAGVVNLAKKGWKATRSAADRKRIAEIAKILSATGDEQTRYLDDVLAHGARVKRAGGKADPKLTTVIRLLSGAPASNEAGQRSFGPRR